MKKISLTQKIISVLLAVVMMLPMLGIGAFAAGKTAFKGKIYSDTVTDLSGIKLDVYGSKLSHNGDGFQKYKNSYLFSVYTDKKGAFKFDRPEGMFVVVADMGTLPKKTGITENIWTVPDKSTASVSARVKNISKIDITCENAESGDVTVHIFSRDKQEIFCNYTSEISKTTVTETADKATGRRTFHVTREVTVRANGMKKSILLESESTETVTPVVSLERPEYKSPRVYTEAGGFFAIHYEKGVYTEAVVKNIYGTFKDAKAFYDKYGFKTPKKENGGNKFNVYLVTSGVASATTRFLENGGYIILQAPTGYERTRHVFITSVIAHEFFHAIMNEYTRSVGVVPSKWFREAFANYAGVQFLGYSSETPNTYINIFQSNPGLPLTDTYDSRVYGAMMFALTISEYYGGMDTIKKIFEEFPKLDPKNTAPEFDAISAALAKREKGMSFQKAFMRFALNNMYPSMFYSLKGSKSWKNAARSADTIRADCSLRGLECKPLSTRYYDAALGSGKSLYITIYDNAGKYSDTAFCCAISKGSGSPSCFYDSVKSFCTYKITASGKQKISGVSFGLVNASVSVTQSVDMKIRYA